MGVRCPPVPAVSLLLGPEKRSKLTEKRIWRSINVPILHVSFKNHKRWR